MVNAFGLGHRLIRFTTAIDMGSWYVHLISLSISYLLVYQFSPLNISAGRVSELKLSSGIFGHFSAMLCFVCCEREKLMFACWNAHCKQLETNMLKIKLTKRASKSLGERTC